MDDAREDYPPCAICDGPNDIGEVCKACAEQYPPVAIDLEAAGGWMVQDGRGTA